MENRNLMVGGLLVVCVVFAFANAVAEASVRPFDITAAVREDLRHQVRPGGVAGRPFWNGEAKFFMYPPAFDFPKGKPGWTKAYLFEVLDSAGRVHVYQTPEPYAPLTNLWEALPTGHVTVNCSATDGGGHVRRMGTRLFWKQAPFTGKYAPAKRPYAEAVRLGYEFVLNDRSVNFLVENGEMDRRFEKNCYPTKMNAAIVNAMTYYAMFDASKRERALRVARAAADWLIAHAEPAMAPLAHFPPTYQWEYQMAGEYAGQIMMIYPALAGSAFLRLHEVTGEARYLEASERIADTYLKLQGPDGTWSLKLRTKDGSPVGDNRLVPINNAIPFLEELAVRSGNAAYREAADRAFSCIANGRLKTWNWESQFEDSPLDAPYENLTKHDACACAIYLLKRYPDDGGKRALARELLRFAEDQFVCWETPFTADYPDRYSMIKFRPESSPCALEQYHWYVPIDASAAKLIRTYLALYEAEGNELDLLKAKALGDAITRYQRDEGWIQTHWDLEETKDKIWLNCHIASVQALEMLSRVCKGHCRGNH